VLVGLPDRIAIAIVSTRTSRLRASPQDSFSALASRGQPSGKDAPAAFPESWAAMDVKLTKTREITPYLWVHPDEER